MRAGRGVSGLQPQAGPARAAMLALAAQGFAVREVWLGEYFDGLSAVRRVGAHRVEVWSGGADNGEPTDLFYPPRVYVDDRAVAFGLASVEKAARVAAIRVQLLRAAEAAEVPA